MHEKRNFVVIILLAAAGVWAFFAWLVWTSAPESFGAAAWWHRGISVAVMLAFGAWLYYALNYEDSMPDNLAEMVGGMYYDADGLSFMPMIRVDGNGQAELCVYYQNRYENYCCGVIHLRPPGESFVIKPGARDVHIAFKAQGGDFGVIHQPIAVPRHLQGEVIDMQLAAVSRFPRSHGKRLRSHEGLECGSLIVDWGQAFKVGVHEVSGEIELRDPVVLHLSMPSDVQVQVQGSELWKQEQLLAGMME